MTNRTSILLALSTLITACSGAPAPAGTPSEGTASSAAQALTTPTVQFTAAAGRGVQTACPTSPITTAALSADHVTIWISPAGDKSNVHTVWARVTGPDGERVALMPVAFSATASTVTSVSPKGYASDVTVVTASTCSKALQVSVPLLLSGSWMAKYGIVGDYLVEAIQSDSVPYDTDVAFASNTITFQ